MFTLPITQDQVDFVYLATLKAYEESYNIGRLCPSQIKSYRTILAVMFELTSMKQDQEDAMRADLVSERLQNEYRN